MLLSKIMLKRFTPRSGFGSVGHRKFHFRCGLSCEWLNTCRVFLTAVIGNLVVFFGPLSAAPMLPTLPTGTQYRVAFITSTVRDAGSSNITDYNDFVTAAANSQPILQS